MAASSPVPSPVAPSGHMDCVCGLAAHEGRILLVANRRRLHGEPTLCWDLPGGRVEPGEPLAQALAREWTEETGLAADVGELLLVEDGTVRRAPDAPALRTWRTTYFAVQSEGAPVPADGVVQAQWVPRDEVLERLTAPYHSAMRAYLEGARARYATVTWIDTPVARPHDLDEDVRDLLAMAAAGALGLGSLVHRHAAAALRAGASPERVAETLLQLAPYCGFPRTLAALGAVGDLWEGAVPAGAPDIEPDERRARGRACFESVYADGAPKIRAALTRLHPRVQDWIESFAYGRVLAREGALTLAERELLAVSMLVALGNLPGPLLGHMRAAQRLGATPDQIGAAVRVVPIAANDPREVEARALLTRLAT